ncbi:hypothetical protein P3W85_04180 [Cupriavidus basilensis]|uniref:CopG family transcriptional regulator n=1 Tax=Cupriavidus basilensis TaxID=68895 RepID=A0ABT6AIL8_9BURK|nr:hypothetical protein [Cupriavidus basilensis]MDF3832152.1 hypothetical protein [Cupriavidus basilensis]
MGNNKARFMLALDESTSELLKRIAEQTGLTASGVITRLLGAHITELWEYETWLGEQAVGTRKHSEGINLMVSYGPDNLVQGIKRIDPAYQTQEDKFLAGLKKPAAEGDAE